MLHLVGSRDIYLIHFVQSDKAALLICIMYDVFLFTLDAAPPPPWLVLETSSSYTRYGVVPGVSVSGKDGNVSDGALVHYAAQNIK